MSKGPKVTQTHYEFSRDIPEAHYLEMPEGVDVFSWSPWPAGTRNAPCTQVHLQFGKRPGNVFVVRFKGTGTLDALIDALIAHRENVWGKR